MKIIEFSSEKGQMLLKTSGACEINWKGISSYTPQQHKYYCGLATIISLLKKHFDDNADINKLSPEIFLDHTILFGFKEIESIRSFDQVTGKYIEKDYPGLSIEDAQKILMKFFKNIELYYGKDMNYEEFIDILKEKSKDGFDFIINYSGENIGLNLGGHFSTVGAVNLIEQKILLLDPAQHKNGWYWISFEDIFHSIGTIRPNNRSRGILIIHN